MSKPKEWIDVDEDVQEWQQSNATAHKCIAELLEADEKAGGALIPTFTSQYLDK